MNPNELKARTKQFALRILKLSDALPRTTKGRVLGGQLIRSGTSTAANYRATCRARSRAEFVSKIGNVIEEADESALWLEMIIEDGLLAASRVQGLLDEANELVAIMTSSRKTASKSLRQQRE